MRLTTPIRILMQPELISESQSGLVAGARALAHRLHIPTTFAKFLVVGGIGFVINQVMLFLLYGSEIVPFLPSQGTEWDIGPYTADARLFVSSIIAVETAIFFQFLTTPAATHILARASYVSDYGFIERTAVDELRAFLPSRPHETYGRE